MAKYAAVVHVYYADQTAELFRRLSVVEQTLGSPLHVFMSHTQGNQADQLAAPLWPADNLTCRSVPNQGKDTWPFLLWLRDMVRLDNAGQETPSVVLKLHTKRTTPMKGLPANFYRCWRDALWDGLCDP